jgi:anti-sigma-K factor RskA
MDIKKYIASGILELYVAGSLSEKENQDVYNAIQEHPEIKSEVEAIEKAIIMLTSSVAPKEKLLVFNDIKNKINPNKVINLDRDSEKSNWFKYVGWAASIALLVGSLWMYNQNNELKNAIEVANNKNVDLEEKISTANQSLAKTKELNTILRSKNIATITLGGQAISPESYAKVYWNKDEQLAYIDVAGLPEPPAGKVYQVWSLKLDPLSPTSIGILEGFAADDDKVFALTNTNDSQAFGITLEPEGGSDSPTMEQLYTLGVVSSSS